MSHPFSVAVFKDNIYWDDWRANAIYVADKDHGLGSELVASGLPGLMDLKVLITFSYVFLSFVQKSNEFIGHLFRFTLIQYKKE